MKFVLKYHKINYICNKKIYLNMHNKLKNTTSNQNIKIIQELNDHVLLENVWGLNKF